MIKILLLTTILNMNEIYAIPAEEKTEASRKRGKGKRGRKRGGNGLR